MNYCTNFRKVCQNCRCGKAEHNVVEDEDPGFYFVGKIFDRPLRSKEEELEFCYGDDDETTSSEDGETSTNGVGERKSALASSKSRGGVASEKKKVRFEWVPPNTSKTLVSPRVTWRQMFTHETRLWWVHVGLSLRDNMTSNVHTRNKTLVSPRESLFVWQHDVKPSHMKQDFGKSTWVSRCLRKWRHTFTHETIDRKSVWRVWQTYF